ncbi:recombinase family protein [Tannockella kyphosi]|uniref:recombinase family protein n=1 Tax=Tannockella kyphosi TaxID=2899121 RepID=UPI002011949A|nr:recombinase family protein [Tannockella kyphosi]
MAVNQYEREKIIERTNDGLVQVARSGKYPYGGKMMYGYRRSQDNTLVIVTKEKEVIQSIYHQFINHTKLEDISKMLNITHNKSKFTTTFIRRILTNERYTGKLTYKKEVYKAIVPAIITKEEYDAAQKILNKKIRKKSNYLFAGKIYCSCGNIMTCTHGTNHLGNKYHYYQCKPCKSIISENKIIIQIDSRELEITNFDNTLIALEREYKNYTMKLSKIKKKYVLGAYNPEQYIILTTPLYNEQKKILQQKKALLAAGRVLTIGQIAKNNRKDYIDKVIAFITIPPNNLTEIRIKTK